LSHRFTANAVAIACRPTAHIRLTVQLTDDRQGRRHFGGIDRIPSRRRPNDAQFVAVQLMPQRWMAQSAQCLFAVRATNSDRKPLRHVAIRGNIVNRSGSWRRLLTHRRLPPATAASEAKTEAAVGEHPGDDGPEVSTADAVDEEVHRRVERHQHVADVAYLINMEQPKIQSDVNF
jgi:hypothetical protein